MSTETILQEMNCLIANYLSRLPEEFRQLVPDEFMELAHSQTSYIGNRMFYPLLEEELLNLAPPSKVAELLTPHTTNQVLASYNF